MEPLKTHLLSAAAMGLVLGLAAATPATADQQSLVRAFDNSELELAPGGYGLVLSSPVRTYARAPNPRQMANPVRTRTFAVEPPYAGTRSYPGYAAWAQRAFSHTSE